MPFALVLVCEDFLPFRLYLVEALRNYGCVLIICEVGDGQDAVRKANELKPDLILLDIGLPSLDGIAAAHQIRKLVPDSKIIFVSQESSPDVVQEAMKSGVSGYVHKARAGSDLEIAVQSALEGTRFISRGLVVNSPVA
jgi:DNA-binding NarL/FixJ family response regulator